MNEHDRRRRTVTAQGLAALALLVFAHGGHAATTPVQQPSPGHAAAIVSIRPS